LPYLPGIDGLRALAVIAVLLYHSQDLAISALLKPQAGFLGVEVFFVISGFLITALLLGEHGAKGRIDLKDFWVRRARRLLPALYVFLAGTVAVAALFATDALDKIRREILGALFYFSNWLLLANDESYFEASGRPSLLRHLWSLAIEEQFYLIWPIVVWGGLKLIGRTGLFALTLVAIGGSTALMWWQFDQIDQFGDVTSVYFRTDARAAALLVGSTLAMVWQPWSRTAPLSRLTTGVLDVVGLGALVGVVALNYLFTDRTIEWATQTQLYHGGFLLVSLATAAVLVAVAVPDGGLGWLIGNPVMQWIGRRSYGIYLWHWPIFQLTRPRVDVDLDGYPLMAIRVVLTLVFVELSYRLIEEPIRRRRFVQSVIAPLRTPRGIGIASAGALAVIALTATVAVAIPTIDRTPTTQVVAAALAAPVGATPTPVPTPTVEPTPEPTPTVSAEAAALITGSFDPSELVQPTPLPTPTQTPLPPPPPLSEPFDISQSRIHIVGDSVMEGAISQLYRIGPGVTVDTRIGRQWWELEAELRAMRAQGLANDVVIIQLGNNGNFNRQMFDGVMSALAGTRLVIFVNIHAPVVWEAEVNRLLASSVSRYPDQARLVDWYSASLPHPEYFIEDGTHLQFPGMVAFRALLESTLISLS
jgi:peptidoglycan/LPS O-acetylase OafA/YrhL